MLPAAPAPLMPHSPLPGGVPQLSLPGRDSDMTPHCSWQQHLPRSFWGSPGIQLHWEHLWQRGEEDQCQLFVPGLCPRLGERYVGHGKNLAQPHQWGGSQPLRDSQSLGQPPSMSPPKGPSSRAVGQPLPWAQVPLVPAEVPGAVPHLAGAPVVLGWCSALPGCPRAESLCDRRDRAQCHGATAAHPGHGALRGNWHSPVIQYPVSCSGPSLCHVCQAPRHSPTPRGCPGTGWHRGEAVMGTELSPSLCCQCQWLCPICAECVCTSPAPAPATFLAWFHCCDRAGQAEQ